MFEVLPFDVIIIHTDTEYDGTNPQQLGKFDETVTSHAAKSAGVRLQKLIVGLFVLFVLVLAVIVADVATPVLDIVNSYEICVGHCHLESSLGDNVCWNEESNVGGQTDRPTQRPFDRSQEKLVTMAL